MPEILEVESARALIEARALDRSIEHVHAPDAWFLKRGLTPRAVRSALRGRELVAARRRGKLILVDTDGPVLGLHLGMSGRVLIDGEAAGDPLVYASNRAVSAWHRFGVRFADGGSLFLRDPRRLGAVELDPDEDRLGPDAFDVTLAYLRDVLGRSRAPVKAVLMDQSRGRRASATCCATRCSGARGSTRRARPTRSIGRNPPCPPRDPRHAPHARSPRRIAHR